MSLPTSRPKLSAAARNRAWCFSATFNLTCSVRCREQVPDAELVALDTMNLWIDIARESLQRTIEVVDVMMINDGEARQVTEIPNLIKARERFFPGAPKHWS